MSRHWLFLILSIPAFAHLALADQIVLKNGDRITGTIVKSDEKSLTLRSEFAGTVTIPMDAVVQISSDQPLHVTSRDGKTLVGTISADAEKIEVRSAEKGAVHLSRSAVAAVRSGAEQAAWERMQHPGLLQLWTGAADAGFSLIKGNAESSSFNLAMNAARATTKDKISLYATSIYARNSTTGVSLVSANAKRGGGRYDFNINSKSFAFGFGDLEADDFQELDLRVNAGGGFGWHTLKTERLTLDCFGGGALNREYFSTGLKRTSGDVVAGNEFSYKLGSRTVFKEKTVIFPNLSETGEFRLAFDTSVAAALNTWLGWQLSVSDRYLSNPLPGTKANDVIVTTGIRVTFAR